MDDGFLLQFLAQAWRGIALIVGLLVLAAFIHWRNANKAKAALKAQKEAIAADDTPKKQKKASKRREEAVAAPIEEFEDDFEEDFEDEFVVVSSQGSIFEDEELFPVDEDESFVADSPPVARQDAQAEGIADQTPEDEEEAVDLASLLSGMVDEPDEPKVYHLISEQAVAVKLTTKRFALAKELLTIFRDERDARLLVQIGELGYRTLENDAKAKKTFTAIMKELSGIVLNADDNPPDDADVTGITPNKMVPELLDVHISSGGDTKAREMISILRDEADGHLIIQIGNTGYRTLVDNAKAKTGFSKIMKELSTALTTPDDNPPIVPRKATSTAVSPQVSSIFDDDDDEILPGDIRMPKMDDMPDAYEVDRFGRVKVKKIRVQDKVEEVNIASAIEEYLQYKVSITPEFQKRGIHIRSAYGGGVRIEVDGNTYEFVDEVEDEAARTFIKGAIDEWQERH